MKVPETEQYRKNVAALVRTPKGFVSCYRTIHPGWQCVQGGYDKTDSSTEEAILRELVEELGAPASAFTIRKKSGCWRRYRFLEKMQLDKKKGKYVGQEQMWFLVDLSSFSEISLQKACGEFSQVREVDIHTFLAEYLPWKRAPFFDFCCELDLLSDVQKRS